MPLGINKTNFMTPQQNSKIKNEHLKPESSSIYKNSKSAIKQINQNFSNLASKIKDGIESAKYKVSGSNMDALYNIKDTNIHGKENKNAMNLITIKHEYRMKNLGDDYKGLVENFNLIADRIFNKTEMKISKNDLKNFEKKLETIKDKITPEAYEAIKSKLNKLM
jgi:hypothetical protein